MEPADINWKRVESRYVRDEAYEQINAPTWADLSNPDSNPAINDVAWFCRPDCRHPKTAEDFQRLTSTPKGKLRRSSTETLPLGERNAKDQRDGSLKRRGGAPSLLPSSSLRESPKAKPSPKKFREDIENRDPNGGKTLKEAMKSSTEKKRGDGEGWGSKKDQPPRLKSTLSARNLFAGKDLLGQISEFCHELKKMALRKERDCSTKDEARKEEEVKILGKEENEEELVRSEVDLDSKKKDGAGKMGSRLEVRIGTQEEKNKKVGNGNSLVLRDLVRSCPPTPQRFPSPSSRRLRSTKAAAATSSPLSKAPKSLVPGRGILQELDKSREEKRAFGMRDEEENRACVSSDAEGSSVDVFWFLKPCTYLAK